jgi:hypothetical protein
MINLIHSTLTADEIASMLRANRRRDLLPDLNAPVWKAVQRKSPVMKLLAEVRAFASEESSRPLPALPDELYALFFKTGERLPFESVYFDRRRILGRVAIVVLFGDEEERAQFSPVLMTRIEETLAEESWTFPAHVWTVPSGKDPMTIDLFAAETANVMAELLTVFGPLIPEDLSRRIRARLRAQFFENYLARHAEFTWTTLPMNWNAVCHQGVIGAALAVEDDVELLGRLLATAAPYLAIFLKGFGNDGSTSEGPGYWSYGFGRFAELNRQLETATNGSLSLFEGSEQIGRIADFAPALAFSNGYLVNFSDGGRNGRLPAALLGYLGERLAQPILVAETAALYRNLEETGLKLNDQRCDFFALTRLFLYCPESTDAAEAPAWPDVFLPDYGAVISRGRDTRGNLWEFAAKGGHNDEHHNHNDCGSYVLNFNGEPAVVEIGSPEYVHGYFGTEKRYTFLAARSLGHSVPLVNGCEQAAGAEFAARVLSCAMDNEQVTFSIDLTKCYPAEAHCRKLVRTFTFFKWEGRIQIVDEYELDEEGTIESMIICQAAVLRDGQGVGIDAPGGTLRLIPGKNTSFVKVEVCDYSNHSGRPEQINRLRFQPVSAGISGAIRYDIRPL